MLTNNRNIEWKTPTDQLGRHVLMTEIYPTVLLGLPGHRWISKSLYFFNDVVVSKFGNGFKIIINCCCLDSVQCSLRLARGMLYSISKSLSSSGAGVQGRAAWIQRVCSSWTIDDVAQFQAWFSKWRASKTVYSGSHLCRLTLSTSWGLAFCCWI